MALLQRKPVHALIKLSKCLISTNNVHNDIWGFKPSWRGKFTLSVGYLYLVGGKKSFVEDSGIPFLTILMAKCLLVKRWSLD